jgi:hypothetical protein
VEPVQREIVVVDVSGWGEPDPVMLDALVRLQLAARRLGTSIRLENACPRLVDLLAAAGLSDVLPALPSGVEMHRQIEQGEQVRVDEEIETGDAAP